MYVRQLHYNLYHTQNSWIAQLDPQIPAQSMDSCAMHGSTDCAAQSMDCADPQIAPNTYSKQPIFGLTQEWLRESLSRLDLSSFGPALFEIWWHDIYLGGPYGPVKDEMYWPELVRRSEKCAGPAGQCLCRGLQYSKLKVCGSNVGAGDLSPQYVQGSTLAMCPLARMHFFRSSGHNNSFYAGPRGQWLSDRW